MTTFQKCLAIGGLMGLTLLPASTLASTEVGGLQFGGKGGITIGSCAGFDSFFDAEEWGEHTPDVTKGSRTGVAFGGFATYWLSPKLGLQAELLWAQGGCKRDFDVVIENVTGKLEMTAALTYIEIPILVKYAFNGASVSSPFLCFGPSVGLRSAAELEMKATSEYAGSYSTTEDIKDYVKSTNFSLMAGLGYTLRLDQVSVAFEARYVLGLIDVMEETGRIEVEEDEYIMLDETKPRTFAIMISVSGN
ncbi:MAG: PorT family protein [Candidatus Eisenbacteria sp.]|nr:PorT family protein [Candidatus Eisenbacteria bacterium]